MSDLRNDQDSATPGYAAGGDTANILKRLRRIEGQVRGIAGMVEDERYCPDIMKQVSALEGSLEGVNRVLLQNHIETCVLEHVKEGRSAQVVDELMETLRYSPVAKGTS